GSIGRTVKRSPPGRVRREAVMSGETWLRAHVFPGNARAARAVFVAMDRSPRLLVFAALAVTIVLWASAFVAIRSLLPALGPGGRLGRRAWAGLALALAGAAVVALSRRQGGGVEGALLVAAAAAVYALWIVLQKRALRTMSPIQVTAWGTWFGALIALPFGHR